MSGFKLIAVRPLEGCNRTLLKNLKVGELYKFYNDYKFLDKNGVSISHQQLIIDTQNEIVTTSIEKIEYSPTLPSDVFELKTDRHNSINASVSAVVGKNGSGKSTIVELFSLFAYCLSNHLGLIDVKTFKSNHELKKNDTKRLDDEMILFKSFNCEIYFLLDNQIINISKIRNQYFLKKYESNNGQSQIVYLTENKKKIKLTKFENEIKLIEFLRESFFYSILANYSLYGLNTNESGIWLKSIFHKNDGYQTPIVMNPMRTEGVIDINRLTYLSKSRLLSNVFRKLESGKNEDESLRNLVNNKIVEKVILSFDFKKFNIIEEEDLKNFQNHEYLINISNKNIYLEYTEKYKDKYFQAIIDSFFLQRKVIKLDTIFNKLTIEYILRKTYNIIKTYPQYKAYSNRVFRTNANNQIIKLCFSELANDYTHSTFKLRQALNFLIYNFYNFKNIASKEFTISNNNNSGIADKINSEIESFIIKENEEITNQFQNDTNIDLDENIKNNYKKYNLINFLPPSFFEIDFKFKDKGYFKDLSSGEKQMIYSINSLVYHLINLKSINSEDRISYKYFNLVLDEIELCFHPEFQRKYLHELLKSLNTMSFINGINIVFLTHSPFILSDIPNQNILRLEDGFVKNYDKSNNTFGANIYSLLSDSFFMENTMGALAEEKMKGALKKLTDESSKYDDHEISEIKFLIDCIGEPIIKEQFEYLYNNKFVKDEVTILQNRIIELENLLKKRKNDSNKN